MGVPGGCGGPGLIAGDGVGADRGCVIVGGDGVDRGRARTRTDLLGTGRSLGFRLGAHDRDCRGNRIVIRWEVWQIRKVVL